MRVLFAGKASFAQQTAAEALQKTALPYFEKEPDWRWEQALPEAITNSFFKKQAGGEEKEEEK